MTHRGATLPVLSLFPGIDLLGRGFEEEGFCVVRGPDLIFGGDVRRFTVPRGAFAGIIGGSPCQEFSSLFRCEPTGYSLAMLQEFLRCVEEGQPDWFLLENVARVPTVILQGYEMQRIDLNARECGLAQRRLRHFQFGSRHGLVVTVERQSVIRQAARTCLASEGRHAHRRTWAEFCQLQGLPADFALPGFTKTAAYRAVGNGVPVPMARAMARAIRAARPADSVTLCACSCGREVTGRQKLATVRCRKKVSRERLKCDAAIAADDSSFTGRG